MCAIWRLRLWLPLAGLLGFPPKELQYRFLSQFTSVFYIRQRDYSKASHLTLGTHSPLDLAS